MSRPNSDRKLDGIGIARIRTFTSFTIPLLIPSLTIKCELFDRNRKRKQLNQPITKLIPNPFTFRHSERKRGLRFCFVFCRIDSHKARRFFRLRFCFRRFCRWCEPGLMVDWPSVLPEWLTSSLANGRIEYLID